MQKPLVVMLCIQLTDNKRSKIINLAFFGPTKSGPAIQEAGILVMWKTTVKRHLHPAVIFGAEQPLINQQRRR
ncbi:hypothetical protein Tel_04020 [Candidatus Tenderia electrophaga]|jgi:hypothetical protein|uniref:Uncharacterized protein n=1 Tax=Candidatus Tenderia electrophaga TaxID=1748243 RepID=A0A0S2TB90_9GAMM|nr:hypothetical protein Tel_04020 [Candidatus Tenderia electrophaga]